jgi:hypothetical protein
MIMDSAKSYIGRAKYGFAYSIEINREKRGVNEHGPNPYRVVAEATQRGHEP